MRPRGARRRLRHGRAVVHGLEVVEVERGASGSAGRAAATTASASRSSNARRLPSPVTASRRASAWLAASARVDCECRGCEVGDGADEVEVDNRSEPAGQRDDRLRASARLRRAGRRCLPRLQRLDRRPEPASAAPIPGGSLDAGGGREFEAAPIVQEIHRRVAGAGESRELVRDERRLRAVSRASPRANRRSGSRAWATDRASAGSCGLRSGGGRGVVGVHAAVVPSGIVVLLRDLS